MRSMPNRMQFKQMSEALREHTGDPNFLYVIDYRKKSGQVFPGEPMYSI